MSRAAFDCVSEARILRYLHSRIAAQEGGEGAARAGDTAARTGDTSPQRTSQRILHRPEHCRVRLKTHGGSRAGASLPHGWGCPRAGEGASGLLVPPAGICFVPLTRLRSRRCLGARLCNGMKMRWHKMFLLLCMAGLCVISVLHFLKALSYVSLSRELVSLSPNFISGFFWESRPLIPLHPEKIDDGFQVLRTPGYYRPPPFFPQQPKPLPSVHGESLKIDDVHQKEFVMQEDTAEYFVRTKSGGVCFKPGTKALDRQPSEKTDKIPPRKSSPGISRQQQQNQRRRKWVECVCLPGWHGPSCGVPTVVQHSNLPTKDRLTPRLKPRRVINAININHEFDLLEARFHELEGAVDVFLICESNFTAYGESRPLVFRQMLLNGSFDYIKSKVVYVFLDHFPEGGKQDGWIADDYLRTFLTRNGVSRLLNLRDDDLFIIDDADEIPSREGVLFLKLYDGWTEPVAFHMRKSLYGFFWKQPGTLEVISACTIGMLRSVYSTNGILLRRREYYTMPNFRQYENKTGHILVQWSLGSPLHFAGWHCSWCFPPEGIHFKLISAQNGDFPRWGDYEDKKDLNYIRWLIKTGGWFDGTKQEYPAADPREHMYAPKYIMENTQHFGYLIKNPYS